MIKINKQTKNPQDPRVSTLVDLQAIIFSLVVSFNNHPRLLILTYSQAIADGQAICLAMAATILYLRFSHLDKKQNLLPQRNPQSKLRLCMSLHTLKPQCIASSRYLFPLKFYTLLILTKEYKPHPKISTSGLLNKIVVEFSFPLLASGYKTS